MALWSFFYSLALRGRPRRSAPSPLLVLSKAVYFSQSNCWFAIVPLA